MRVSCYCSRNFACWTLWMTMFVSSLVTLAHAQTPTTAFTLPFDWTTKKINILPETKRNVFKVGETVTISTSNNLPITVFDLYWRTVFTGTPGSLTLAVGHYFVQCNGDRNQFIVLPNDYVGASFLGDMAYTGYRIGEDRQQRIQPGWVRAGVGAWRVVQPVSGAWNWTNMDIAMATNAGRKILVIAGGDGVPAWVQPANLTNNYAAYITALVARYPGKITAVEIWNEPGPAHFWNDPQWLRMLADIYAAGSAAIRAVDPDILVVGPTPASPSFVQGTAALAQYGFSNQIDGLSLHDYWAFKFPPDQNVGVGANLASHVLGRVQAHRDAAQFNGPFFVTEMGLLGQSALGIPTPPIDPSYNGGVSSNAPTWSLGMMRGIKYATLYRAAGAEMINPHLLTLEDSSLTDQQNAIYGWEYGLRGPEPKTSAFLMSCYWLEGATLVDYRTLGEQIYLLAWRRPNNTSVVFAWAVEGQSWTLTNRTAFSMTDIYGASNQPIVLNSQPVLIHTNSPNASGLLASLMANLPRLNLAPVLTVLPNQTVLRDQLLEFTIRAMDPDHDPVVYSASVLPSGASLNPTTGLFSWIPTAAQAGTYTITFTATDARGLSASTTTVITVIGSSTDGLMGWWKFDESAGTVAFDFAGSNPGSLLGFNFTSVSGRAPGRIGNSLIFDGSNDYVQLDSSQLNVSNNFTIASWINPAAGRTDLAVFFCLRSKDAVSGIRLAVRVNNDLIIEGQTATGWKQIYHALGGIQNNVWQHIVVVYDKSAFAVYINGVRVPAAHGHSGSWDGDVVMNPTGVTRVGAEGGGVATHFFKGLIDDVRVYNRTLTPTEVTTLHQWTGSVVRPRSPANMRTIGK